MPTFRLSPKPGNPDSFINAIRRIKNNWSGKKIAAKITVPDELIWWYFQEFGTSGPYEILPKDAQALYWPGLEHPVSKVTNHPGNTSRHMVTLTLNDNLKGASKFFEQAMRFSKWDFTDVRESLLEDTMPAVKANIVSSIAQTLPGSRSDGKLHGDIAADVFDRESQIANAGE